MTCLLSRWRSTGGKECLSQLSDEELDSQIESVGREYRSALGGACLQNEQSLSVLKNLDLLWYEKNRRNRIENERIREERERQRTKNELLAIASRRPKNPTIGDIPSFDPDTYQRAIKSSLGYTIVRSNTWDLYEFDLYLWAWKRRTSEPRRVDINVRWENRDPEPTQADIDFASNLILERTREMSTFEDD